MADSIDSKMALMGNNIAKMDVAVKNMANIANNAVNQTRNVAKDCENIGAGFQLLGSSMCFGEAGKKQELRLDMVGDCFKQVGKLHEGQSKRDWEVVGHLMHDFKGLVSSWYYANSQIKF